MPAKERQILLKIAEAVRELKQPVSTTFAPSTGVITPPQEITPAATPQPVLAPTQQQGGNFTAS